MGSNPSKPPHPASLSYAWTNFFPPTPPPFTPSNLPADLSGRTYVITGANSGMGLALAQTLYSHHARVIISCRAASKLSTTLTAIKAGAPDSRGELVGLELELSDLESVKRAGEKVAREEKRINVLFNNAGVMTGPGEMQKTAQGIELALGVNCVGTFLFTSLVTPVLLSTAASSDIHPRVVWVSSWGLYDAFKPPFGIDMDNLDYHEKVDGIHRYGISKVGTWALGVEYGRRVGEEGVVSVVVNPGNIRTELTRSAHWLLRVVAGRIVYPVEYGVGTLLFAGFSEETEGGKVDWHKEWVVPFGRVFPNREDIVKATKPESEGGTGGVQKFWEWNEKQVKAFL